MKPFVLSAFLAAFSLPSLAGDTQPGTTVTWKLTTETTSKTGNKKYP